MLYSRSKDYMFRPVVAIIRSLSLVVLLTLYLLASLYYTKKMAQLRFIEIQHHHRAVMENLFVLFLANFPWVIPYEGLV